MNPRLNVPEGSTKSWRLGLALLLALSAALCRAQATNVPDASAAERLVFLTPHLSGLKPPTALRYQFVRKENGSGGFTDQVDVRLSSGSGGACCNVAGSFLTGERAFRVPEVPDATANPVLLYFLEHEIRQMQRATKGQAAHFQKRIRLAMVDGATLTPTTVQWQGREVAATAVRITPYVDDPYRARFEREAEKVYTFVLSDAVPGQVFQIRAELPGVEETLTLAASQDAPKKK
jgi:hypothetical protein